eukprot:TRINITY_DN18303_c0_g1_i1.p1 TRINITY_DN18303_c0_g1~~TRINITY_DN18303_c0_g1_i1.p1  ORF type:complete len:419 (-),score=82.80 TRINITY_DN18303_c0_g1_i1:272-1387(-)
MYELVSSRGYKIEKHFATTPDGYILGMFHMPPRGAPNGKVVFLQHALLDSSFAYILNGPGKSLGFILADKGYDVWFGNNRGNTYSTNHTSLSTHERKFWDFTFSEMARLDLPTQLDYTLAQTGVKTLTYFGHSQGTMQAFAGFSLNQTLASRVELFVALAPVAYVEHQSAMPLSWASTFHLDQLMELFGGSFLKKGALNYVGTHIACNYFSFMCDWFIDTIVGQSNHFNQTRLPVYISQTPAGTSTKNIVHFAQEVRANVFGEFDYGKRGNQKAYGQDTPPQYDLSAMKVPTILVTGAKDILADPKDVLTLRAKLPQGVVRRIINIDDYAHLDFTWADDASEVLYPKILAAMENFTSIVDVEPIKTEDIII